MRLITITITVLLLFLCFARAKLPLNYLPRGSSLSVEHAASNALISSDRTFSCGFYSLGFNAYWFAIWFTNSKDRAVVWMANRDNPVNGRGSRITLRKDGALVLTDFGDSTTWKTNTSFTNVDRLELLHNGNLVLKDSTGEFLWQSFDFPTTTLLPGQLFTKNKRLVSQISPEKFGSGFFSLFFDSDNVLRMMYDGPEISSIYWPNPDYNVYQNGRTNYNSTRTAVLDDLGYFLSSDRLEFSASDNGLGIKRRLTIDPDGNLRVYSLNNYSGSWSITWQAVSKSCDVHGLCGRNGICTYTPEPRCSCPPYYEVVDSTDRSKGCKPKFKRDCGLDKQFVEIPHADYYGFDLNYTKNVSFMNCQDLCSSDCRCQGFKYVPQGDRACFTKSALFNGRNGIDSSLYLRVPAHAQMIGLKGLNLTRLQCNGVNSKEEFVSNRYEDAVKRAFRWVYLYSFLGGIGGVEVIILVASWIFFLRKHGISASLEDGYRAMSSQFRSFSYAELKKATENFKHILGTGGFGAVYKGVLSDERAVAVKKLEGMVQGEEEFWAEVSTIGRINHMNLARMWGFCSERKHKLLVYEYVENGSLDKHLFSSSILLGWAKRFKIALGTAKGLAYLHHECLEWVIHCDVKPENILLDCDYEPKISDFGLAKLCQRGGNGASESMKIRGTKGYMAPEWTTNLPLTAKVDVYSYGVVILELVKGVRLSTNPADDPNVGEEDTPKLTSYLRLARRKIQDGEELCSEELVDQRLGGEFDRKQAAKMIEIGILCIEDDRNKRPTMEAVVQVLADCEANSSVHTVANL